MSYYVAPCLLKLTREVNERYGQPYWPTVSIGDGAVGDTSHQARPSDHNPDYSAGGVVRAVDIGISGRNAREILNQVIGDPRVYYVIHNGIIYSRTYNWRANRYTGSNPHNHHIHVSCRSGKAYENDTKNWYGSSRPKKVKPGPVDLNNVREQFMIALGKKKGKRESLIGIKRIQYGLYWNVDKSIVIDGYVGEKTLRAWGKWERSVGLDGRPRVPDMNTLRKFDKEVWAVKGIYRKGKLR